MFDLEKQRHVIGERWLDAQSKCSWPMRNVYYCPAVFLNVVTCHVSVIGCWILLQLFQSVIKSVILRKIRWGRMRNHNSYPRISLVWKFSSPINCIQTMLLVSVAARILSCCELREQLTVDHATTENKNKGRCSSGCYCELPYNILVFLLTNHPFSGRGSRTDSP